MTDAERASVVVVVVVDEHEMSPWRFETQMPKCRPGLAYGPQASISPSELHFLPIKLV